MSFNCLLIFLDLSVGGNPSCEWQDAQAIPFQFDIEGCDDDVLKCLGRNRFTCLMPFDK